MTVARAALRIPPAGNGLRFHPQAHPYRRIPPCDWDSYARANAEMKRKALEQAHVNLIPVHADEPAWEDDSSLVSWLQNLCR